MVPNPDWATRSIAAAYDELEKHVQPAWLPKIGNVKRRSADEITAKIQEYGCGMYGCVYPTFSPDVVLKLTTDITEIEFATTLANSLVRPICVKYHFAMKSEQQRRGVDIWYLWRESADEVGNMVDLLDISDGTEVGDVADDLLIAQHNAAQVAYLALFHFQAHSPKVSRVDVVRAIEAWVVTCEAMAQQAPTEDLRVIGASLVEIYDQQHILFGDLHVGNFGRVRRGDTESWVITDPGHIAVLSGDILADLNA